MARAMLLFALLVAVGTAPPAGAAVRFGLQPDHLADSDIARMGLGGVQVLRLPLDWRLVEPNPGERYDHTEHDRIIASAAAAGIQILPVFAVSPTWAAKTPAEQPVNRQALELHDAFVKAMVARYGPGGDFWLAHPGLPQLPLTQWQIWNEPNLKKHWTGKLDPRKYVPFLKRTRAAVLSRDPTAQIVLAGMPEHHQEYPCSQYLRELYEVKGARRLFDVVAVNAYQRRTRGLETALRRLRGTMDKNGDRGKTIWVSEMGWASAGPSTNEAVTDLSGQASRLRKGLRLLRARGPRYGLTTAVWYTLRDHILEPHIRDRFWFHTGLFALDGSPKPAWREFTDITGGDPGVGPL